MVTVGSIDRRDAIAPHSRCYAQVDLCAPGVGIYTTAHPQGIETTNVEFGTISGTSFAAPQVAAAASLLKAQNPDWDASEIESRLFSTTRLPEGFVDANDGHGGAPDGRDDDGRYGYGALDAAAAVGWSEPAASSPPTGGSLAGLFALQGGGAR